MNPRPLVAAVAVTATLLSGGALAQQAEQPPSSPEQMKQFMQTTMGVMVSVMGPMTAAVIEAQLATAAKPETAARIASFKRNLYQALVQSGFNEPDAMRIVVATPLPSASPALK